MYNASLNILFTGCTFSHATAYVSSKHHFLQRAQKFMSPINTVYTVLFSNVEFFVLGGVHKVLQDQQTGKVPTT